jgi:propanol-preferring alcohol dehydrogenase
VALAKTMRAGVVRAFGKPLTVEEMPVPTPGPGEVLIKVVASGVCHTDLHARDGDWPVKPSLPFVPGHEGAGIVAACGPGVVGLKEGDRAAISARSKLSGKRPTYGAAPMTYSAKLPLTL